MPHITQIAAIEMKSAGSTFNQYVTPRVPITTESQMITGIRIMDGQMTVKGEPVENKSICESVTNFLNWICKFPNAVLVAHNGRRFDFPVLLSALSFIGKRDDFVECVIGFIDSLSVFRKLYPRESLKQEDLVSKKLGLTYDAHNATADVALLRQLLQHTQMTSNEFLQHSYPPIDVINSMHFSKEKSKNLQSLTCLVSSGVCKLNMAENIAGSGLKLAHLQTVFNRAGEDGLRDIFVAKNSEGAPRVTSCKKVLDEVIPRLVNFFKK